MDLRIVMDTAERFVVQGGSSQTTEKWVVFGLYGAVLYGSYELSRRTDTLGKLTWVVFGLGTLLFVWCMASLATTGGIRFDLDIDRANGVWTTEAVYPRQPGQYFHPPLTRSLGEVLRVDIVSSPGKGGNTVGNQRILITLENGTTFEPFEGEDRGSPNEYLVLDRMQKMMAGH